MLNEKERQNLEKQVLHGLLFSNTFYIDAISLGLNEDSFAGNYGKLSFIKIRDYQRDNNVLPDMVGLYEYLFLKNQIKDEDFKNFITSLSGSEIPSKQTTKILIEDNAEREAREQIKKFSEGEMGLDFVMGLNEAFSNIIFKNFGKISKTRSNAEVIESVLSDIQKTQRGEHSEYIKTGFKSIDKKIIGIHKKSITILAARPGMGKTAYMLQLTRNFLSQGYKAGLISIEMDAESLMIRELANATNIDSIEIESGNINNYDFERVCKEGSYLSTKNFVIDDSPHQNIESIKTRINSWKINNQADIVFIDYLTLLELPKRKDSRNDLSVGQITNDLRIFAKNMNVPIILLAQLNREVEKRADKKPQLSDLRESGNIEQDARTVLFLYVPTVYGLEPQKPKGDDGLLKNYFTEQGHTLDDEEYCEVIIAKCRNGKPSIAPIRYIKKFHRFESITTDRKEENLI